MVGWHILPSSGFYSKVAETEGLNNKHLCVTVPVVCKSKIQVAGIQWLMRAVFGVADC